MGLIAMNKSDIRLIIIILAISIISLGVLFIFKNDNPKVALVYYEDELVLRIDLSLDGAHEYRVDGYNGQMVIKTDNGRIKVEEEDSPLHICSRQGWIEESYEVIVCLPNKVVIKIEDETEIDTVVK